MKKLWSLTASTLLLGGGLLVVAPSATADPYVPPIDTICQATPLNTPRLPHKAKVRFDVDAGGDNNAHGTVRFTYKSATRTYEFAKDYFGPAPVTYKLYVPHRGKYHVSVHFNSKPADSPYKDCDDSYTQRIRPRR